MPTNLLTRSGRMCWAVCFAVTVVKMHYTRQKTDMPSRCNLQSATMFLEMATVFTELSLLPFFKNSKTIREQLITFMMTNQISQQAESSIFKYWHCFRFCFWKVDGKSRILATATTIETDILVGSEQEWVLYRGNAFCEQQFSF